MSEQSYVEKMVGYNFFSLDKDEHGCFGKLSNLSNMNILLLFKKNVK